MRKLTTKRGWIKTIRKSKGLKFIPITDGVQDFQITMRDDETELVGELKIGASIDVIGYDSLTPRGSYEFVADRIVVVGESHDDYPLQPKKHSDEFFRSIPHMRGRAKQFQSIWKLRHYLTQSVHKYMDEAGFFQYYTPIITQADCEGAGETFKVKSDWMDEQLTVSGQLHGEVGMMSLGKIYTFAPTFRAEKSATRKHLSEFWMIEPEIAWYGLYETMIFTEAFIKGIVKMTQDRIESEVGHQVDISQEFMDIDHVWKIMTYEEVRSEFVFEYGLDISSEIEKRLTDKYGPVFITHYPKELKPFYMKKEGDYALCFDLIFPVVGELVGGSQREDDYDTLIAGMEGMDMDKMKWYAETRKWGSVPHSGFGLGFERLLMYLSGVQKVHDVIPFPVSF
jgi:asparaginyl-tRNA synthetase